MRDFGDYSIDILSKMSGQSFIFTDEIQYEGLTTELYLNSSLKIDINFNINGYKILTNPTFFNEVILKLEFKNSDVIKLNLYLYNFSIRQESKLTITYLLVPPENLNNYKFRLLGMTFLSSFQMMALPITFKTPPIDIANNFIQNGTDMKMLKFMLMGLQPNTCFVIDHEGIVLINMNLLGGNLPSKFNIIGGEYVFTDTQPILLNNTKYSTLIYDGIYYNFESQYTMFYNNLATNMKFLGSDIHYEFTASYDIYVENKVGEAHFLTIYDNKKFFITKKELTLGVERGKKLINTKLTFGGLK